MALGTFPIPPLSSIDFDKPNAMKFAIKFHQYAIKAIRLITIDGK